MPIRPVEVEGKKLPVGFQIIAGLGQEGKMFGMAARLEEIVGLNLDNNNG